jgi:hypothetical protein
MKEVKQCSSLLSDSKDPIEDLLLATKKQCFTIEGLRLPIFPVL